VDLNDQELDAIRDRTSYRVALWVMRAAMVVFVVWRSLPGLVPDQP
jgi:hypothetical protein